MSPYKQQLNQERANLSIVESLQLALDITEDLSDFDDEIGNIDGPHVTATLEPSNRQRVHNYESLLTSTTSQDLLMAHVSILLAASAERTSSNSTEK